MDPQQQERFREAVERKRAKTREQPSKLTPRAPDIQGDQQDLYDPAYPPDELSVRDKSTGKGHKTADKWNQ